ncbi:SDR family NAD(P)-dependent oxidoreductase [Nocardia sp. NPDC058176]|uniref:SDR family NAD(P)-dependent oxidoreductase n=1 Tax=Nocardia sp. NPDC058176 TaxID=3346368 RepID=UPI0036DC364A
MTGAGQGVGREIALRLAQHTSGGVAVNDYVLERAQQVAAEIEEAGGRAFAVQADVSDIDSVKEMVIETEAALGTIGVLVNNAGNMGANPNPEVYKPFWETGPAVWNSAIGVNFYGVLNCVSAVVPGLIARNAPGRIITIVSDASRYGDSGLEIYGGAKAGAAGFMRGVARTLGRHQITANNIAIAATETPATAAQMKAAPELLKKALSSYIVRRPGQPVDVANMALFLASDASSWITGQTYPVNGGFTLSL